MKRKAFHNAAGYKRVLWGLQAVFIALPAVLFLTGCAGNPGGRTEPYSETFFAMDTYMTFTIYGAKAEDSLKQAEDRIRELEGLWSVTDTKSDIYAVNHSGGKPVAVDGETEELLSFALEMAEETGGALEPTIYPVLAAWGFTTGENRVPDREEIEELLNRVDAVGWRQHCAGRREYAGSGSRGERICRRPGDTAVEGERSDIRFAGYRGEHPGSRRKTRRQQLACGVKGSLFGRGARSDSGSR